MGYLQPWMLWVLPAALLPIIIHLLNRLRYKTVHWAAMIFLLKANRAATRRAKLRQYLLLACRVLLLLFLIWAMARPLVGGWMGAAAGGAPETVLLLLDRSASMEGHATDQPESKRQHALALLSAATKQSVGSRFVLIESVQRQPLEIADASGLGAMQDAEATDTAADLPAMFRSALDYLVKNKPGSAEVWVASDLQATNWHPDSPEWQDIAARFAGLPEGVRVRILDLSAPPGRNASVEVKSADLRVRDEKTGRAQLSLTIELKSDGEVKGTLPVFVVRDGAKSETDLTLSGAVQRRNFKYDMPKAETGWGKVELPADDNPADNSSYFVYAPSPSWHAVIVGEGPATSRLRVSVAPDKTRTDRSADVVAPARFGGLDLKDTALVIWAAAAPDEAAAKLLTSWTEAGGVVLCVPPGGDSGPGPLGMSWGPVENEQQRTPFRVTSWDELDGPLEHTDSGQPLALARLDISRRQLPSMGDVGHVYGAFADGKPFLLGRKVGNGRLFAFATQPDAQWGNLGEGLVLLPAVQRILALGGQRLTPPTMALAGEWKAADPDETWVSIETDKRRDWRWHAGVYQNGTKKIALNRPDEEDSPEVVDRARLPDLLHGVKLTVMAGALELKADRLQSEIWSGMVLVAMLFMCAEMLLATSKAMLPLKPSAKSSLTRSTPAPEPAGAR